jgi:hypothetical protein
MNAQSIHADQVEFQDTATNQSTTTGFSLLPGFIACYQNAQRVEREARQVYAMSATTLHDMGIESCEDIPAHPGKIYR